MNIPLDYKVYINSKKLKIIKTNDNTVIYIQFETKPIDGPIRTSSVFSKENRTNIGNEFVVTRKGDTIYVSNMYMFKTATISELKYMIGYVLNVNITEIKILCNTFDYVIQSDKERSSNWEFLSINNMIYRSEYENSFSVGSCDIICEYTPNTDPKQNNYNALFITNYRNMYNYVVKCLSTAAKNNISNLSFNVSYKNVTISLVYGDVKNTLNEINIIKLFNMCHLDKSHKWRKILIHDTTLDEFLNNPREMQYIKSPVNSLEPFKNMISRYNCCSVYFGMEVSPSITLSRMEILKNTTINCVYTITDPTYTLDNIKNELFKIYTHDGKFWNIFKKLMIEECIFNLDYNNTNYIPIYTNFNTSYMVDNCVTSDISKIYEIVHSNIPEISFKTNTSVYFHSYTVANMSTSYAFIYSLTYHEFVTDITIREDLLNRIHVSMYDKTTINIKNSNTYSIDDLIINMSLILPMIRITAAQAVGDIDAITKIRNKYLKIPTKMLIKLNLEIDPTFFGARIVKNKIRQYSSMSQKREQRVVPITKEEYVAIYKIHQTSCMDIKNQTVRQQRLYLFCPYESHPFLNFHYSYGQLCTPKCTAKPTNRTQFTFCSQQLGAEGYKQFTLKDYSNMIVFYNPLLTPGRKCKIPDEFNHIIPNYILYKPVMKTNIYAYCMSTYNMDPFILRRDANDNIYHILTEYEENNNYMLVLQSEFDELYYIFMEEVTSRILIFSENENIREFFRNINSRQKTQYNIFNYIEKLLKINIKHMYANNSLREILKEISHVNNITYIVGKDIINGIIYNNTVYMTPKLYWKFNTGDNINVIPIFKIFTTYMFPDIKIFNKNDIKHVYKDYVSNMLTLINYEGVLTYIKPNDGSKYTDKHVTIYDHYGYTSRFININFGKKYNIKSDITKIALLKNILYTYIYIYVNTHRVFDKDDLEKILTKLNVITDNATFQKYTDKYNTYVSWRTTKMTKDEYNIVLEDIGVLSTNKLIKIIYDQLQNDMVFKVYRHLEDLSSKIITINN